MVPPHLISSLSGLVVLPQFSEALQQLFVGMDSVVPLEIRTTGDVPAGAQLRFLLRFQEAKYSNVSAGPTTNTLPPRCIASLNPRLPPAAHLRSFQCRAVQRT